LLLRFWTGLSPRLAKKLLLFLFAIYDKVLSSIAKTDVLERTFSCLALALLVEGKAKAHWDDFRPRPTSTPLLSNREHFKNPF
jgi:hypothetical protein